MNGKFRASTVQEVQVESRVDNDELEEFFCGVIHADSITCSDKAWWIQINVCDSDTSLKCKVDTGAQANIISLDIFSHVFGET